MLPMKTTVLLVIGLAAATLAYAAVPRQWETDFASVAAKFPNLKQIQHFSTLDVVVIGSKARIGMKESELNEFARYCFVQLFKGYDLKPLPDDPGNGIAETYGTLNVTIETYATGVSGLSIELRMGTVGSPNTWKTSEMRVSTANQIKDARLLKTSIATMLGKAAYTLRRSQGKNPAVGANPVKQ